MSEAGVETFISEEMRSAVGREISRRVSYPVSASDIRRWAIATYYPDEPPRRFWDEQLAATTRHGGIVAPLDFNPFAWMAVDPPGRPSPTVVVDHVERALGIASPPLPIGLNAGIETEFGAPIRPGDTITSVRVLGGYREREGSLGTMLLTTTDDTWTNQDAELVLRRVQTHIRYAR